MTRNDTQDTPELVTTFQNSFESLINLSDTIYIQANGDKAVEVQVIKDGFLEDIKDSPNKGLEALKAFYIIFHVLAESGEWVANPNKLSVCKGRTKVGELEWEATSHPREDGLLIIVKRKEEKLLSIDEFVDMEIGRLNQFRNHHKKNVSENPSLCLEGSLDADGWAEEFVEFAIKNSDPRD